tara:strand:- start:397 stop:2262 length:1866 start_codon:yes stop_codon:yes gene_type:complete
MAEDLNNLFQDFENKSLEELGSSLLSRKAEINRKNQKAAKKSQRIGQALTLMGVGQSIFKNAYDKRMKELDEKETFLLANNKSQAADINNVSRIVRYLPDADWFDQEKYKGKSPNELAAIFIQEESGQVGGLKARFAPVIDNLIKAEFADENEFNAFKASGEYNTALTSSIDTLVKDYFQVAENGNRKYMNFENDLRKLLDMTDPDIDKAELYKRGINLQVDELTTAEKRMIRNYRNQYEGKGFRNGFKDMLKRIGRVQEEKGNFNLFKNIDKVIMDDDYLLTESLKNMNVAGHLVGDLDDFMADYRTKNTQYKNKFFGDTNLQNRVAHDMKSFYQTSQMFNTGKGEIDKREATYDPNHILRIAGDDDTLEQYLADIINNPEGLDFKELQRDVGELSLAFRDDIQFATRAYEDSLRTDIKSRDGSWFMSGDFGVKALPNTTLTDEKIKQFQELIISDEQFRNQFSLALLVRHGLVRGGGSGNPFKGFNAAERYNFNTEGKIYKMYKPEARDTDRLYESNNTPIAGILTRGITYDSDKRVFNTDDDWDNMNSRNKKLSFDTNALNIMKAPEEQISTENKLNAINLLYESNFNPYGSEYSNAVDYLTSNPKFINFLQLFNIQE